VGNDTEVWLLFAPFAAIVTRRAQAAAIICGAG
jgi:hypothetical protein